MRSEPAACNDATWERCGEKARCQIKRYTASRTLCALLMFVACHPCNESDESERQSSPRSCWTTGPIAYSVCHLRMGHAPPGFHGTCSIKAAAVHASTQGSMYKYARMCLPACSLLPCLSAYLPAGGTSMAVWRSCSCSPCRGVDVTCTTAAERGERAAWELGGPSHQRHGKL